MNAPALSRTFAGMSQVMLDEVARAEALVGSAPQTEISTQHTLHAGMYARTMLLPAGNYLVGTTVQIKTIVIFDGDADVFVGDTTMRLTGHHVIVASAFRKQIYKSHTDCHITAIHATNAKTVAEAEAEATEEHERLASRRTGNANINQITGGEKCLTQQ